MAGAKESVRGIHCLLPRRRLVRTSRDVQTEEEEAVAPLCPAMLGCSSPQRTVGARGSQGFRKGHGQQGFGGLFNAKTTASVPGGLKLVEAERVVLLCSTRATAGDGT